MTLHRFAIATLVGLWLTTSVSSLRAEPANAELQEGFVPDSLPVSDTPYSEDDRVVIGKDDRAPVLSLAYPYSTIGRIDWVLADGRSLGYCTGTLIGRDLVLTNSHCLTHPRTDAVVNPTQYQQGRDKIVFKPAMIRGEAQAEAEVVDFAYGWGENPDDPAEDWAILKLDRPLGDEFGYLGWLNPDFTNPEVIELLFGQLRIVGYAADFPTPNYREFGEAGETAGQHAGCGILGAEAGQIFHQCDTNPGASGSALLGLLDNGQYVVLGLHAGSVEYNREWRLPGGELSRYLNRGVAVEQWAAQAGQMRTE